MSNIEATKKSKDLPLVNAELKVEAGQKVTFFKYGQTIVLATKGQIYDPKVKAEHIPSIFKDYTEEQIKSSDKYQIVKMTSPENRINPDFVSPQRKKMRAEDDWKLNSSQNDRNQVLLQDVGNIDQKSKFNFKSDKMGPSMIISSVIKKSNENSSKFNFKSDKKSEDKKCPLCLKKISAKMKMN